MDDPGSAQTCKKIKKLLEDKIYKKNKKINNKKKRIAYSLFITPSLLARFLPPVLLI
jgi:hypothetical protein